MIHWCSDGASCLRRRRGREVHIALAGGTTPQRACELLGYVEGSWEHVHLWLGDERCVPNDAQDAREHDPDIPAGRLGADLDEIVCDKAAAAAG